MFDGFFIDLPAVYALHSITVLLSST